MALRDDDLHPYVIEIRRLREENACLRLSSKSFADLAERLNKRLEQRAAATSAEAAPSTNAGASATRSPGLETRSPERPTTTALGNAEPESLD